MNVLVCAATSFEIAPTIAFLEASRCGTVEVLITGVGLPSTIYHLTKALQNQKPDLIIQAGIAGSLDKNLSLGQVVFVRSDFFGDLGVVEQGKFADLFSMGFVKANEFPWQNETLPAPDLEEVSNIQEWKNGVTINEITTFDARAEYYRSKGADIESMEGAGLHFVARQEGIPFLQIRSVSNYVGERDKSKWMMQTAIQNLNNALQHVLTKLNPQWK